MHILIVEDDERIISFMKRGLEAESYEVTIASSKAQTMGLTETCTYDGIILDIFLGPDDGLDICRTLRQRGVKSSILLMTAKGTAEVEKMSKQAGADAYLAKPFSFDELLETLACFRASGIVPNPPPVMMEQPVCSSKNRADAFTKSDLSRPTNMAVTEIDPRGGVSTSMHRMWKRL